jgi:hypothetical protein
MDGGMEAGGMNHGTGLLMVVCAAGTAAAQHTAPGVLPRSEPGPIAPTKPAKAEPVEARDIIPGLTDDDVRLTAAALRAEGTFLVEKRASMVTLGTGEHVAVFHKDEEGKRERPMVLVRCQRLAQMVQMAEGRGESPVFIVTGQVSVYRGVNYLQPTAARAVSSETLEAPTAPAVEPPPGPGDPGVQDLIRQLESQRESQRGGAAPPESTPAAEENEAPPVAEGRAVVRRRGRLVRLSGGEWALAFDTGTAAGAKAERPMLLSPCLNLQRMEMWAMQRGDAASFEVSGRTLAYGGRTYLIPTMFQVYPPNELEARQ